VALTKKGTNKTLSGLSVTVSVTHTCQSVKYKKQKRSHKIVSVDAMRKSFRLLRTRGFAVSIQNTCKSQTSIE
jgi:hypothetical protein